MKTQHASEEILQQYAASGIADAGVLAHIKSCESCKQQAAAYQLIILEIKESPKPVFEFDLSAALISQIANEQPVTVRHPIWDYLWGLCAIILLAIPIYLYKKELTYAFLNAQWALVGIVIIAAVMVISLQIIELNNKYRRQARLLDMGNSLQH